MIKVIGLASLFITFIGGDFVKVKNLYPKYEHLIDRERILHDTYRSVYRKINKIEKGRSGVKR